MRKIIVLLSLLSFSAIVWSQKVIDVDGTYKGQKITVKGRYRPNGTAEITSFSYAPYDKLNNEVNTLKSKMKSLEEEKKKLENKISTLEKNNNKPKDNKNGDCDTASLQKQIRRLNKSIDSLSTILNSKSSEMNNTGSEIAALRKQLEDSATAHRSMIDNIRGNYSIQLKNKDEEIAKLKLRVQGKGLNGNTLGIEASYGSSTIKNNLTNQDFWKSSFSPSAQIMATYTLYFSKKSPVAIKIGVGYASYNGYYSAVQILDTVRGLTDDDGDKYDAHYNYSDIREKLSLKYLEVPILLHIGNSYLTNGVQAWIEAGIKASFNISSSFNGEGKYSCEGYYPDWNVTLSDIDALGFVSNSDVYPTETTLELNKFVIWGIISAGMNIPLGEKVSILVGAQCGYSLLPVSTNETIENRFVAGKPNVLSGESTRIFNLGGKIGLNINL